MTRARVENGAPLWPLAPLSGILALALVGLLQGDRVPVFRDLLVFAIPFKHFLAESLRQGEIPLWNPYVFMGTPFLAALQSGVFYPPSLILLLPFPLGFNLFLFAHYGIALAGAYLWLRQNGRTAAASALGALLFALGGYLVSVMNLTNHLQGAAWAPWVLLAAGHRASVGLLWLAAAVAMQLLAGSPETVLLTLAIATLLAFVRDGETPATRIRALAGLGAAVLLGAGLAAFQLLPTLEYVAESARRGALPYVEVSFWSLEPVSLLQLLFPHSTALVEPGQQALPGPMLETNLGALRSIYFGVAPLCLMIGGFGLSRIALSWICLLAGSFLLALGSHAFLFPALYDLAPEIFGRFRYPAKFFFVAHLAAVPLAANGLERLLEGDRRTARAVFVCAVAMVAIAAGVLWLAGARPALLVTGVAWLKGGSWPAATYADLAMDLVLKSRRLILVAAALAVVTALFRRGWLGRGITAALLILLTAADLGAVHHDLNVSVSWSELRREALALDPAPLRAGEQRVFHYQTTAVVPPGLPAAEIPGLAPWMNPFPLGDDFRRFARRSWSALFLDLVMLHEVGTVTGFDGISRLSYKRLVNELTRRPRYEAVRLLRLYSVGALIGPVPLDVDGLEPAPTSDRGGPFVYRLGSPVPAVYLATGVRTIDSRDGAFDALVDPQFRPGIDAVVERLPAGWQPDPGDPGDFRVLVREPERWVVRSAAPGRRLLVVNESDFPGWEATVDGTRVPILRVNALVRGVALEAGAHEIELRYRPSSLRRGAWVSLASLALALAIAASARIRREEPA